ncbi:hypothetical protein FF38_04108 [Lucilia cuprina]|uniref:Uncharacterized protein n=1 Tax=Lucilia cuprina TaxID=7375 RepID=A0A0L0BRW9_LUCCU|nr:hypothetical protein CVS40_7408 [Lucilia cuprina]KNC22743.1 hypothetical protein FF38_04108 [Lucilia cuprina]
MKFVNNFLIVLVIFAIYMVSAEAGNQFSKPSDVRAAVKPNKEIKEKTVTQGTTYVYTPKQ